MYKLPFFVCFCFGNNDCFSAGNGVFFSPNIYKYIACMWQRFARLAAFWCVEFASYSTFACFECFRLKKMSFCARAFLELESPPSDADAISVDLPESADESGRASAADCRRRRRRSDYRGSRWRQSGEINDNPCFYRSITRNYLQKYICACCQKAWPSPSAISDHLRRRARAQKPQVKNTLPTGLAIQKRF